jgi:hypothetical protein
MAGSGYLFLPPVNGNSTVVPERYQVGRHRDLVLVRLAAAKEALKHAPGDGFGIDGVIQARLGDEDRCCSSVCCRLRLDLCR